MLMLNQPQQQTTSGGRRKGLPSSAPEAVVQLWIDDAVEALTRMPYTCSLDVVDEKGAISDSACGELLGITHQAVDQYTERALEHMKAGVVAAIGDDEEPILLGGKTGQAPAPFMTLSGQKYLGIQGVSAE